jgi:hypothetical protein
MGKYEMNKDLKGIYDINLTNISHFDAPCRGENYGSGTEQVIGPITLIFQL